MPNQDQKVTKPQGQQPVAQPAGSMLKEADIPRAVEPLIQEVPEFEVPKEVAGHVSKIQEHIEIPPDLKNIGVTTPHSHGKVSDALQKDLNLPLTDDQIGQGRKADIKSSFRWLAEWCFKQLLRAGFDLRKEGEHSIREKVKQSK